MKGLGFLRKEESTFELDWLTYENQWLESHYRIYFTGFLKMVTILEKKNKQIKKLREQIKCSTITN